MKRALVGVILGVFWLLPLTAQEPASEKPLRLAIAGLVHGHVSGFLKAAQSRADVQIVGVFDPDRELQGKYAAQYKLPETIFFSDLATMLERTTPQAVASFTSTADHPSVVEAAAARHVPVMMEKPLAVSVADAQRIRQAAERGHIQVFVNYETTWYPNHAAIWSLFKERAAAGEIRKMVALDGHQGPKKINVQPEFFKWLTDPVKNGAGALFDFGCYGANLMTWLMDNQRPLAVSAVTQQFQPDVYPRVDDEATVVVEYPRAVGIIQASWNWPFNRKDFEVYGDHGIAVATTGGAGLRVTLPNEPEHAVTPEDRPRDEHDSISHLIAVVHGRAAERAVVAGEQPDRDRDSRGRPHVGAHACAGGAVALESRVMIVRIGALARAPSYALPVPIVQRPRTWPFQGQNTGSNPVGDATTCIGASPSSNAGVSRRVPLHLRVLSPSRPRVVSGPTRRRSSHARDRRFARRSAFHCSARCVNAARSVPRFGGAGRGVVAAPRVGRDRAVWLRTIGAMVVGGHALARSTRQVADLALEPVALGVMRRSGPASCRRARAAPR